MTVEQAAAGPPGWGTWRVLVARELERLVARQARYEEAMRRAVELMASSEPRGGRTWRRDDLYQK